ncbi:MAG: GNAT family N-acetyltransferase [Casimicrobiaceae bacterium]
MTALLPMTPEEFLAWETEAVPTYAAEKVASGQWKEAEAPALARKSFDELLPQGLATPDNHLFTMRDQPAQVDVGTLWVAVQERAGKRVAYVYDVAIKPEHRRKGHAMRAFLALEDKVRSLGLAGIALHVFGHNAAAHALYLKLGYLPTNINMYKAIEAGSCAET